MLGRLPSCLIGKVIHAISGAGMKQFQRHNRRGDYN
jgi:hypothetical protein